MRRVLLAPANLPIRIYLVGFMGSGKSTIARALAARLRWQSEDVDDLIERRERRTIADIFAKQGEPYFRAVEREMLKVLQPLRHVIVATGGGTFADPDNRAAINLDGTSVWIEPKSGTWVVLLSNRSYNPKAPNRIRRLRRALFNAVTGLAPKATPRPDTAEADEQR